MAILKRVDALGGTVKAIEEGYFQREIADSAYEHARRKASGEQPVIGVNKFVEPAEPGAVEIHRVDPAVDLHGARLGRLDELVHRSGEHTSELQSRPHLVCRLLL